MYCERCGTELDWEWSGSSDRAESGPISAIHRFVSADRQRTRGASRPLSPQMEAIVAEALKNNLDLSLPARLVWRQRSKSETTRLRLESRGSATKTILIKSAHANRPDKRCYALRRIQLLERPRNSVAVRSNAFLCRFHTCPKSQDCCVFIRYFQTGVQRNLQQSCGF
jgi:hypothetical protein